MLEREWHYHYVHFIHYNMLFHREIDIIHKKLNLIIYVSL